ncbi:50S ribosome-binding GTPase [Facklamia sp. DSM 111018]|uniref:50S ribosome-binding GTPase n=1 Tax=Facklamia lactis TaxID=2749967 RepID=A0ABS0LSF3_9LACT|nr:GTPase [Facklamia lactis]MBG9981428.1 50S ribosome-binding GTPase [Facklamia lactis]MBG9987096.1 50S ribosome-binding GTPase [Facklamia lactis]
MVKFWKKLDKYKVDPSLASDLLAKSKEEVDKMLPINILLVGKTGSGKSTLVNALFREQVANTGIGMPITQNIQKITKEGVPLTLYDTKGLELNATAQKEVMNSLLNLIHQQKQKGVEEEVHLIYYCINANMARIEAQEIALINTLAKEVPVIVILTQSIGHEVEDFVRYIEEKLPQVKQVLPILAKDFPLSQGDVIKAYGLQEVIETSLSVLPKEVQKAFINAQQVDLNLKIEKARGWAHKYITSAFGVGVSPLPIADAAILVPMQITMLAHITSIFGLSLDYAQIVSIIAGIGGTGTATMLGKYMASSALKWIPGIGSVGSGIISGTTASTLTMTLAYAYIEVLCKIMEAEIQGKELPIKELQKFMNASFTDYLTLYQDQLGDKNSIISDWFEYFLKKRKR